MLSEIQKINFTPRAKEEARKILKELGISKFIKDTGVLFQHLNL